MTYLRQGATLRFPMQQQPAPVCSYFRCQDRSYDKAANLSLSLSCGLPGDLAREGSLSLPFNFGRERSASSLFLGLLLLSPASLSLLLIGLLLCVLASFASLFFLLAGLLDRASLSLLRSLVGLLLRLLELSLTGDALLLFLNKRLGHIQRLSRLFGYSATEWHMAWVYEEEVLLARYKDNVQPWRCQ